jgi:23S rRNA pseudouridine2605 synthase
MVMRLTEGVALDDGPARFDAITAVGGEGANRWFHVSLHEGRNREVRRLWESQGVTVSRLLRFRYGSVVLPREHSLGDWWELSPQDVTELRQCAGLVSPAPSEPPAGNRSKASRKARHNLKDPTNKSLSPGGRGLG